VRGGNGPAIGLAVGFAVAVGVALVGVAIGGRLHQRAVHEPVTGALVAPGS
jgi:hypothetical protein